MRWCRRWSYPTPLPVAITQPISRRGAPSVKVVLHQAVDTATRVGLGNAEIAERRAPTPVLRRVGPARGRLSVFVAFTGAPVAERKEN